VPLPAEVRQLGERMGGVEGRLTGVESQIVQLRLEMADGFSAVKAEFRDEIAVHARETAGHVLETQRQMRVLYEDLVGRIALIAAPSGGDLQKPES
jgi:hypothetical protein